jgi:nitroreductase / dihydropteridine reductase
VNFEPAARQAYIDLDAALIAATFEEVDATPMEGFDPAKLDEILKMRERGLRTVAIVPLGYLADAGEPEDGAPPARAVRHRGPVS